MFQLQHQEIQVRIKTRKHNNIQHAITRRKSVHNKPHWKRSRDFDKNLKIQDTHELAWRTRDAIVVYPERNVSRTRKDRKSGNKQRRYGNPEDLKNEHKLQIPWGLRVYVDEDE